MEKIIISACLLGKNVRYNGEIKKFHFDKEKMKKLCEENLLIPICPEMLGGLAVPRPQSEIKDGVVINILGENVDDYFVRGAKEVLKIAKENNVKIAILKQNSPSCGSKQIYDGTFSKTKIDGMGITAKYLAKNGIEIKDENFLENIERHS